MGYRHLHLSMSGMVLNFRSGSIAFQYHVVYDDMVIWVHSNESVDWTEELMNIVSSPNAHLQFFLPRGVFIST